MARRVIVHLDYPVFIKGITSQPNLIIDITEAWAQDKTIIVELRDNSMVRVTDTMTDTIPANTKEKTINLGDYLDTQWDQKGLQPGLYFIIVGIPDENIVAVLPIMLSSVASSPLPLDKTKLVRLTYIDKLSGIIFHLPPTIDPVPVDDRFIKMAYYHDTDNRLGRMVGFDESGQLWDTGWARKARITQRIRFQNYYDLAYFLLQRTPYLPGPIYKAIVDDIEEGNAKQAVEALVLFYMPIMIGDMAVVSIEEDNEGKPILVVDHWLYLGGWGSIVKHGALGCAVGAAVGLVLGALTFGVGTPAAVGIAGFACASGAAASTVTEYYAEKRVAVLENTIAEIREENEKLREDLSKLEQELEEFRSNMLSYLAYLKDKYNISDEDYSRGVMIVNGFYNNAKAYVTDAINHSERIEEAASKAEQASSEDWKKWIVPLIILAIIVGIVK